MIHKLSRSLYEENSNANREEWSKYIIERKIPILDLIQLVHEERNVALRFMWLVGHICDKNPKVIYPAITSFFSKRNEVQILNYNCSLAKMLCLGGVPEEIEAEVIDELFCWMNDPKTNVSTKVFAMNTLYNLSNKFPDIKNELKIGIEDQQDKNKTSFDKRSNKILEALRRDAKRINN